MISNQKIDVKLPQPHSRDVINSQTLPSAAITILVKLHSAASCDEQLTILSKNRVSLIAARRDQSTPEDILEIRRQNHAYLRCTTKNERRFQDPSWFFSISECLLATADEIIPSPRPLPDRLGECHSGATMYVIMKHQDDDIDTKKSIQLVFQPNRPGQLETSEDYWRMILRVDGLGNEVEKSTKLTPFEMLVVRPEVELVKQISRVEVKQLTADSTEKPSRPGRYLRDQWTVIVSIPMSPNQYDHALHVRATCEALESTGQSPRINTQTGISEVQIACWMVHEFSEGRSRDDRRAFEYLTSHPLARISFDVTNDKHKHRQITERLREHTKRSKSGASEEWHNHLGLIEQGHRNDRSLRSPPPSKSMPHDTLTRTISDLRTAQPFRVARGVVVPLTLDPPIEELNRITCHIAKQYCEDQSQNLVANTEEEEGLMSDDNLGFVITGDPSQIQSTSS